MDKTDQRSTEPAILGEEVKKEPSGSVMPKRKRKSRWDPVETPTEINLALPTVEPKVEPSNDSFQSSHVNNQLTNLDGVMDTPQTLQGEKDVPVGLLVKSDAAVKDKIAAEILDKLPVEVQGKEDVVNLKLLQDKKLKVAEENVIQAPYEPELEENASPAKKAKVEFISVEREDQAERTISSYDEEKLGDAALDASSQESYTSRSTADTSQSTDGDSDEREMSPRAEMEVDGAGDHKPSIEGVILDYAQVSSQ